MTNSKNQIHSFTDRIISKSFSLLPINPYLNPPIFSWYLDPLSRLSRQKYWRFYAFKWWGKNACKDQLISECLFGVLNFPKNQQKIQQISAPVSKKWSNHKIKAPYSVFDTLNSPYDHSIIRKCLYFVDLTTF